VAKVTAKLQVTIPKAIADRMGVAPGAEFEWDASGCGIRLVFTSGRRPLSRDERLALFDAATQRQRERQRRRPVRRRRAARGWTRDELYDRGQPR
jgi:bifunctional DNA-binding transcriptional regulator/antitoxin component of YhaV-PrlF toxin-antitoxin module